MNTPCKKRPGFAYNGSSSKIDSGIYGSSTRTSSMKESLTSTTMTNTHGSIDYEGITSDCTQDQTKEDDVDDLFSSTLPDSFTLPTFNFNLSDLSILKDKNDQQLKCCRLSKDSSKIITTPASEARKSSKYSQMKAQLQRSIDRDFTLLTRSKPLNESSYFKARSESLNNVSFGLKEKLNDENSSASKKEKKTPRTSIFQELDSIFDTSRYDVSAYRRKDRQQRNKSILETSRASSFSSLAFDPVFNSTKLLTPIESDTSCDTIGNVSSPSFNTTNNCCSCNKKRETSCKSSQRNKQAPPPPPTPASTSASKSAATTNVTTNLNTPGRELTITITVKLPE